MVRYTLALAGKPAEEASAMAMSEQVVDIFHFGQLEETFLCDINPKGQVRPWHPFTASQGMSLT